MVTGKIPVFIIIRPPTFIDLLHDIHHIIVKIPHVTTIHVQKCIPVVHENLKCMISLIESLKFINIFHNELKNLHK